MYITPRYLLAIIRISQSMAKFHFRDLVSQSDVDQAIKLMDFSFNTLESLGDDQKSTQKRTNNRDDKFSSVINDIRSLLQAEDVKSMNSHEILKKLQNINWKYKNYTKDNIMEVLNYYVKLQVVYIDTQDKVIFL